MRGLWTVDCGLWARLRWRYLTENAAHVCLRKALESKTGAPAPGCPWRRAGAWRSIGRLDDMHEALGVPIKAKKSFQCAEWPRLLHEASEAYDVGMRADGTQHLDLLRNASLGRLVVADKDPTEEHPVVVRISIALAPSQSWRRCCSGGLREKQRSLRRETPKGRNCKRKLVAGRARRRAAAAGWPRVVLDRLKLWFWL